MTEFEIQQLIIASRWEFAIPSLCFIFVSMAFMAIGVWRGGMLDRTDVRLLQLSYLVISTFLVLRTYAGILRGRKLGALLREVTPQFEFYNPPLQQATLYVRLFTLLVLLVVTVWLLNRAIQRSR